MDPATINCQEACVNGCVLGDRCPNLKYLEETRKFLQEKSIDEMINIAANRFAPPPDIEAQDSQEPNPDHNGNFM
ncbi:hypothetical protein Pse7367_2283 [Thalassoporum mexicanum PCC 7367]|uniref:hypothetical protein n=1 Tax=Thalassoporum mexicanum TaxID=3457544 RepID=UPI00029FDAE7|nr:hypothetical protein [Pseudanabaena sp. PCC 7367]AFY70546.1 hypothetical protein Pse7367_2283 [Pseudanabaena sp. PCC 7367]